MTEIEIGEITGRLSLGGIPEYMRDGVVLYITKGTKPGSFLTAVFSNDFMEMCRRADNTNAFRLIGYGQMLYSAPIGCHGSQEHVADWIKHRGLEGL